MARTINFVRDRQHNLSLLEVQDRKMFRWALIASGVAITLVLIAVSARLLMLYQLKQVTAEQKRLKEAITSKEEVEKSFTVFTHKLKSLTELFGKRKEKQETLEYFSNLFDQDVVISQLTYSSESEELSFTLTAKNVFVMDKVMTTLNGSEVRTKYPTMTKTSMSRSQDGKYSMNLSIALAEKPLDEISAEAQPLTEGGLPTLEEPAAP